MSRTDTAVRVIRRAEIRTAHTASLSAADLRAVRELLDEAFGGDFSDEDYEHGLGGNARSGLGRRNSHRMAR